MSVVADSTMNTIMQAGDVLLLRRTLDRDAGGGLAEVRLASPVRLRVLRLDPPPRGGGDGDDVAGAAAAAAAASAVSITVFARDLESPLASRFACVGAGLGLPTAGARAFELLVRGVGEREGRAELPPQTSTPSILIIITSLSPFVSPS